MQIDIFESNSDQKRIRELRKIISYHDNLYYKKSEPEISDEAYDELYQELSELEKNHPYLITSDSPTQKPGSDQSSNFSSKKHKEPMLSIDDIFEKPSKEKEPAERKLITFYEKLTKDIGTQNLKLTLEVKIDGTAISLIYKNGKLITALTRGDGKTGDDITENIKTIKDIPHKIPLPTPSEIEIRGEIYIEKADFEKINEEIKANKRKPFINSRNATAGTLKTINSQKIANRPLRFLAHNIGHYEGIEINNETDFRQLLKKCQIPTNTPQEIQNLNQLLKITQNFKEKRKKLPYNTDGIVIKIHKFSIRKSLGATSRAPRWAIAYKYLPPQTTSRIKDITIQVGRSGILTPVAELETIFLDGTNISRASLHNEEQIQKKDIRIGDIVEIRKAGDIIPEVIRVSPKNKRSENSQKFNFFEHINGKCPSCKKPIDKKEDLIGWYCINQSCPTQRINRCIHFTSKQGLDIFGLDEKVLEKIIEKQLIKESIDLFFLKEKQLADLLLDPAKMRIKKEKNPILFENISIKQKYTKPRILGAKKAKLIIKNIKQAKNKPLDRWIYALGIPQIGEATSSEISRIFKNLQEIKTKSLLQKIVELGQKTNWLRSNTINPKNYTITNEEKNRRQEIKKRKAELEEILAPYSIKPEFSGGVSSQYLLNFLNSESGKQTLEKMEKLDINPESENYNPQRKSFKLPFSNKTFAITGNLSKSRIEIKKWIENNGGKVNAKISKKTHYLLLGKNETSSEKEKFAEKYKIPTLNEEEIKTLLKELSEKTTK